MKWLVVVGALLLSGCSLQSAPPRPLEGNDLYQYTTLMQDRAWYDLGSDIETRPEVDVQLVHVDEMEKLYNACTLANADSTVVCGLSLQLYPEDIGYLSVSELNYVYDYYAYDLVPCLATQKLNVGYMPSRDEFAAQAGWPAWDPYSELGAEVPPSRAESIAAACPPDPTMRIAGGDG